MIAVERGRRTIWDTHRRAVCKPDSNAWSHADGDGTTAACASSYGRTPTWVQPDHPPWSATCRDGSPDGAKPSTHGARKYDGYASFSANDKNGDAITRGDVG